jgi:glycosyltransferase involved in cell wall biosynthesis
MRILLVADGRSPTTRRWIKTVVSLGHEVTLVTTFPCSPVEGVAADVCLPVGFSALSGTGAGAGGTASGRSGVARRAVAAFRPTLLSWRYLLGPLTLRYYGPRLRWLAERIQPDLIHALRIPFEGMLASYAPKGVPLAVSIWGNDLTLHANGSAQMAALTRKTLQRADGLLADANRDIRLARAWGLAAGNPALVVPGSGGLELSEIAGVREIVQRVGSQFDHLFPADVPLVINPRGFRTGSVRQDTFFAAIPFILQRRPGVSFACAAMAGQREAVRSVERYHLENKVVLLPHLPQTDLWGLFARAAVTVSVSQHDGTPNTLLEAMALGALPVAGDIESIREWITPGVNGLLVEPSKPQALAEAVLLALDNSDLRARATEINAGLVAERASADIVREKIRIFYEGVAASREIPV